MDLLLKVSGLFHRTIYVCKAEELYFTQFLYISGFQSGRSIPWINFGKFYEK
jgi:hypothetical protein